MMFYGSRYIYIFTFIVIVISLPSCYIETAKPLGNTELTIASDYLKPSDAVKFESFSKKHNIKVKIIERTADELIGEIRNKGFDTDIDLILLESLFDVYRINKNKVLQSIPSDLLIEPVVEEFSSAKSNFIALGIDPYVVVRLSDSVSEINTYTQLETAYSFRSLSRSELVPFLGGWYASGDRVSGNQAALNFVSNVPHFKNNDSLQYTIKLRSDCIKDEFKDYSLPANFHYNQHTVGILNQANDYDKALLFVKHYTGKGENFKLSKKLNIIGLYDNKAQKVQVGYVASKLLENYFQIERILDSERY